MSINNEKVKIKEAKLLCKHHISKRGAFRIASLTSQNFLSS